VRLSGRLARSELESLVDRFARALDERDRTHVFCEVSQLTGLELEGMADHLRRATSMLGKLGKFGRIAIVADQSWVRRAARIESALLPQVSYEVFTSEERDRAFRWVLGEEAHAHGPALAIIETDDPTVVGFEIDGKVTEAELRAASEYFGRRAEESGRLRILARVKRLGGLEIRGLLER